MSLGRKMGGDGTVRDALADEEKRTGRRIEKLDAAVIPPHCSELWRFYSTLASTRQQAFYGVAPITPHDIEAMSRLMGVELTPWEVETILRLDAEIRATIGDQADGGEGR